MAEEPQLLTLNLDSGLAEMCRDGWAWQSANPHGYAKAEGAEP